MNERFFKLLPSQGQRLEFRYHQQVCVCVCVHVVERFHLLCVVSACTPSLKVIMTGDLKPTVLIHLFSGETTHRSDGDKVHRADDRER